MKRALSWIFAAVMLVVLAFALRNVFGDPTAVDAMAKGVVCAPATACKAQMLGLRRTAFFSDYSYVEGKATTVVRCQRGAIFVGEWACTKS
jgi:hypothetical protein